MSKKLSGFQPLPPTPRTKALRDRVSQALLESNGDTSNAYFEALALAEALERELAIANSGWKAAEADNMHLTKDNERVRRVLGRIGKALMSV